MNEFDLAGRTALVVGGSSGIGNGIAQSFRAHGADVHVWGTRAKAEDYGKDGGSDLAGLHYGQVNVAEPDAIAAADVPFSSLDILVLSQGLVRYRRAEFEMPAFREVVEVNLMSLMACSGRFFPMLKESRGSLIIVSSAAAFHSTRGNPAYNASKTGAFGLTRTLAEAWAGDGIRVNGIAPGFVATKMTAVTTENPKRLEATVARIPQGRFGTPADIAGVALFLVSPLAAYVCGQTIVVDGGLTLA